MCIFMHIHECHGHGISVKTWSPTPTPTRKRHSLAESCDPAYVKRADMAKNKLRSEGEALFPGDSARGLRAAEGDDKDWLPLTSRFEGPDLMNFRYVPACALTPA
jgi:hypothetical protein